MSVLRQCKDQAGAAEVVGRIQGPTATPSKTSNSHECPDCKERIYDPEAMRAIEASSPAFRTPSWGLDQRGIACDNEPPNCKRRGRSGCSARGRDASSPAVASETRADGTNSFLVMSAIGCAFIFMYWMAVPVAWIGLNSRRRICRHHGRRASYVEFSPLETST